MRGMLVHDDDAVGCLGNDIGLVQLRPRNTEQVWCKCNYTAADVRPWPLPPTPIDFVSNITLTYLHESMVKYGNPKPNKYRGDAVRHRHGGYSRSLE